MVQMPTASSESAPVRLFPFLSSSSSSFFLIAVVVVVLQRARGFVFFGEKRARGMKIFVPPPRAGGFPFFSLSYLSLFAEVFRARAFGDLLLRCRLCRSFWCNADPSRG
jgi:hypothetical protein